MNIPGTYILILITIVQYKDIELQRETEVGAENI
jgi:hypothetical protein